ncbi:PqqD family protein [Demequina sp. SYSU T00039]|uniref:PqqD family protein n=1 Tax=Demequina lignilytica TaxID=3051663 RepID=A0AAW7M9R5_9MICO|nr:MULTISPECIES: PqqD family protein [unclassified Demequina]MDN4477452.1 PqqD family protein [Demequina sp. SYSU T00039-1]MDN4488197.1 PqqD family protein [Demequina sp. SYSU T00039]
MSTPSPLARHEGLAEVTSEDRATVLNLPRLEEQQVPYIFEGTAFEIWIRIDGTRTEQEIVDELAEVYEALAEEIAPQVRDFVAQLLELRLVVDSAAVDGAAADGAAADGGETAP